MDVINATPQEVRLILSSGQEVVIPPSGIVAKATRESESRRQVGVIYVNRHEVPAVMTTFWELEGLPEPEEGVYFITSALVQRAACETDTHDCLVPADLVRDEQGRVIGARALRVCCEKARVEYPSFDQ